MSGNARDICKAKAAEQVAIARAKWPNNISNQLAYLGLCMTHSAPERQNANSFKASVDWEYIHAVRTIVEDMEKETIQ